MAIQSIAVFCGSQKGIHPAYTIAAKKIGELLCHKSISLIYGGGSVGLMGTVADAVIDNKGKVIGIIPQLLFERERQHKGLTELIITEDMHTRKKDMYQRCDAAIILPGGFGTLDELFEILTWNQLTIHEKKIFLLNTNGFYNHLLNHIATMLQEEFLYGNPEQRIAVLTEPEELLSYL